MIGISASGGWRDLGAAGCLVASRLPDANHQLGWVRGADVSNGLRCLAQFLWDEELVQREQMAVETLAGIKRPRLRVEKDDFSSTLVWLPADTDDSFLNMDCPSTPTLSAQPYP